MPAGRRIGRGAEFAARPVGEVFAALGVTRHRPPAHQPHRKGKVQQLHATIDSTLLCGLPGLTAGPCTTAGLHGPLDDRATARPTSTGGTETRPMQIERFAEIFASWTRWYNLERPRAGLGGRAPAQAWSDDATPLARIGAEQLQHLLPADAERVIGENGIRFNGLPYSAPEP